MAFFWFCCFVAAALFARSSSKKVARLSGLEAAANHKTNEARAAQSKADELMRDAQRLKTEAAKTVKDTVEQNRVYHSAIEEVVNLWVNDSWKSIVDRLTASNHATQKARMEKVFETCRKHGIDFDGRQEQAFYVRLETEWKREVETEKARLEQQRIKEIMREEQQAEKVRATELKKLEAERKDLERRHQEQLERIRLLKEMDELKKITEEQKRELATALEENNNLESEIAEKERRKSMAELTRAGNVYVISNIGSFGDRVFKVGMTRRLIPEDRIKELGDASVPFPFDCHMMIPSEDAPKLESTLHEALWVHRLNLVNDRKEYFRTELDVIKGIVDKHCKGAIYHFAPIPEASDWRESEARRKQKDFGTYHDDVETADEVSEAA